MGTKTISLSDDAYRILSAAKKPGESFSDTVKRVFKKKPLSSFAGAWSGLEKEKIKEIRELIKKERAISEEKYGGP
jgi:predicted CopG family antitoxin